MLTPSQKHTIETAESGLGAGAMLLHDDSLRPWDHVDNVLNGDDENLVPEETAPDEKCGRKLFISEEDLLDDADPLACCFEFEPMTRGQPVRVAAVREFVDRLAGCSGALLVHLSVQVGHRGAVNVRPHEAQRRLPDLLRKMLSRALGGSS